MGLTTAKASGPYHLIYRQVFKWEQVSFPPKYVDLYKQKPNVIKSFGIRISPLLESANIKRQNIEKHFTPQLLCLKQPEIHFD